MRDPHNPKNLTLIEKMAADPDVSATWQRAFELTLPYRYSYNWTWLGRPIIQLPQDVVALQEIVWRTRPEVIVETGIAHGGSLILSASLLALLGGEREVVGVDIDIRTHNRNAIDAHPLSGKITMIEGSSIDDDVAARVLQRVGARSAMVILDSNHTANHVAAELRLYSGLVKRDFFLVVLDTVIETSPPGSFGDRPWDPGNSPMTAVNEFLKTNSRFVVDEEYDRKLLLTVAPHGYLRAIEDI
jgi:cephalosporin hydroxylase